MECCNRTVQVGHRCAGCPHEETSNHMVAAPALTPEFIALVVNERDALRKRVTDLLEANNRLVEEVRDVRRGFERSEDELATVTAEMSDLKARIMREISQHGRITEALA